MGRTLRVLQERDSAADGRLRNSYTASPLDGEGRPRVGSAAATTGNQAWVGLALLALHADDGDPATLAAAVRLGEHVRDQTHAGRETGGFSGGVAEDQTSLRWHSSEHNADCTAFFTRLARATGDAQWVALASSAREMVRAMWRPERGHVLIGTGTDGVTPVDSPVPVDAQTWASLALGDDAVPGALEWTWQTLRVEDAGITGVRAATDADPRIVWLEGSAHLAAALLARSGTPAPTDRERLDLLLAGLWRGQSHGPYADGRGVPAASSDGAASGVGDPIYASLHTGTTAWAVLAALGANPLAP